MLFFHNISTPLPQPEFRVNNNAVPTGQATEFVSWLV
jgi:hypothetical protein